MMRNGEFVCGHRTPLCSTGTDPGEREGGERERERERERSGEIERESERERVRGRGREREGRE